MEDSRAARHDRCVFCVVVFGFGPFFRYVAPAVLRVSITFPARIVISHKTVLVKRSGVTVTPETSANYTKVEVMDPMVQKYCDLYSADLAERLGLNSTILPHYLSVGILLNPLLGKKECVVACGLLTDVQYETARNRKSFEFIVSFLSARWISHQLCL